MVWILALMLMSGVVRGADDAIKLALEETTTLHVGQTAVLDLPADGSRFPPEITAEETLVQIRRSARSVWYRAVRSGRDVIIIAPDVPEGQRELRHSSLFHQRRIRQVTRRSLIGFVSLRAVTRPQI